MNAIYRLSSKNDNGSIRRNSAVPGIVDAAYCVYLRIISVHSPVLACALLINERDNAVRRVCIPRRRVVRRVSCPTGLA